MSIAYFNLGPTARFDQHAVDFVHAVSHQLRGVSSVPPVTPVPPGPDFDYSLAPELFCGRRGLGPLSVVWDTNVVSDYLRYGRHLWWLPVDDDAFDGVEPGHREDLELLRIVLAVWIMRSVEFVVLPRSITDAKKNLSLDLQRERNDLRTDLDEAISLVASADERVVPRYPASAADIDAALGVVPSGADRELVDGAYARGAHVFLTRDQGILRARSDLRRIGLVPLSPGELFDELCACGALLSVWFPERFAPWPFPDLARVGLAIRSFEKSGDAPEDEPISAPALWIIDRILRLDSGSVDE